MLVAQVISAVYKNGHILDIEFNDGHHESVDFATFIFACDHPDYEKYQDIKEFRNYKIIDGNLNWDDYSMIFPVEDLYNNEIVKNLP